MTDTTASGGGETAVHIAQAYNDARNYRRADEVLRSALAENPENPHPLTEFARTQLGFRHYDAAAHAAHTALSVAPNDERTLRLYTLALDGQDRIAEALWMAWRTVTTHPNVCLAHYVYATQLKKAGRLQDALAAAHEALRLQPSDPDTLVLRAGILKGLRTFAESDTDYREALRVQPDHASAMNDLAVNRLARGELSDSLRGFLRAGSIDPALGDLTRRNVGAVVTRMLRVSTAQVAVLALAVIALTSQLPTAVPRLAVGMGTIGLLACVVRFARLVPRQTFLAVVRRRQLLAVRSALAVFGVVIGCLATVVGPIGPTTAAGAALLLISAITMFVGHAADEQLW